MARLPQGWLLNAPVLWLAALLLEAAFRGPLRNAPSFVTKLFRLAAATLVAIGLLISLVWDPVLETSKSSYRSYRDLDLALGAHSNRLGRLVIRTISGNPGRT